MSLLRELRSHTNLLQWSSKGESESGDLKMKPSLCIAERYQNTSPPISIFSTIKSDIEQIHTRVIWWRQVIGVVLIHQNSRRNSSTCCCRRSKWFVIHEESSRAKKKKLMEEMNYIIVDIAPRYHVKLPRKKLYEIFFCIALCNQSVQSLLYIYNPYCNIILTN